MEISYTDEAHDAHFVEACFYEPGEVAQLSLGAKSVTVHAVGRSYAVHLDTERSLSSPHEFRSEFPDGVTDTSEWEWHECGFFALELLIGDESEWEPTGEEYATLDEAVDAAVEMLAA